MAKLSGGFDGQPVHSQHKRFGDVAAVWSILEDLDVVGLVDDVASRYANAGASVGTYLALATLNRVVARARSGPSPTDGPLPPGRGG